MLSRETIIAYTKGMTIKYIANECQISVLTVSTFLQLESHNYTRNTQEKLSDFCVNDFDNKKKIIQGK